MSEREIMIRGDRHEDEGDDRFYAVTQKARHKTARTARCAACDTRLYGSAELCARCERAVRARKHKRKARRAPPCRHCGELPGIGGRGLCNPCHDDLAVRALYPPANPAALNRGSGLETTQTQGLGKRLGEPTDAPPGSPEKIAVLTERAAEGQALWHPNDAGACLR